MSADRKQAELIDRVRYPNPLPLPPYPPKLQRVEIAASRYADGPETQNRVGGDLAIDFTTRLARANQLPVLVDAEGGIPMDLTQYPGIWTGELDALAPSHLPDPDALDMGDEDRFLLTPLSVALPAGASSGASSAAPVATQRKTGAADVAWLRRTEYLASSGRATPDRSAREKPGKDKEEIMDVDTSREAAVARINETFTAVQESTLASLRHPTKPHLRPVASYEFLPDVDTWATNFQLVRFQDWPGRTRAGRPTADPRVAEALLRPVNHGGDQRISLYLVTGDGKEAATPTVNGKAKPNRKPADGDSDDEGLFGDSDSEAEDKHSTPAPKPEVEGMQQSQEQLEDAAAAQLAERRLKGEVVGLDQIEDGQAPESASTQFRFHRDYQAGENDGQASANQYVIVLTEEGNPPAASQAQSTWQKEQLAKKGHTPPAVGSGKKRPVAYYHPVAMQYTLRQKRIKRNDSARYPDMWAGVQVSDRAMSEWELRKTWRTRREVDQLDPTLEADLSESDAEEEDASIADASPKRDSRIANKGPDDGDISMAEAGKEDDRSPSHRHSSSRGSPTSRSPSPKQAASASGSESGSDAESDADPEEMDDELAALQDEAVGQDDVVAEGRRRRRPAVDVEAAPEVEEGAGNDDDDDE